VKQPDVPVLAVAGELVPDREVEAAENDRLSHGQIAQQLAELAATAPDRSNIALYGPWGSGKSGIGNLLRVDIESRKGLGFARFDAFKYAENPLRRNFISAVATELKVPDAKFHGDLYSGQTKTTFDVPKSAFLRLAAIYGVLLFGIFFALLLIAAAAAAVQEGGFWEDFRPLVKQSVVASFTPAALLSALVVLVGKALGVERKTDKADSSEQFEALFKDLVEAAGKKRIVVFVDELDRCAPGDVVATLDAVRTFLGADKCVFVVAADRQAVEEALNQKLKQSTPADPVNPYYSSGSAYLDKVFQYQVLVPPLLQASVTRYAVDLVKGLPGVWQELGDRLDLTVSILVPSHVRSPRRVKNFLNAFALTYRLAEARQKDGRLHGDMALRSDEIARMVCLRIEFPLFARDLVLDARLPEYVLRLHKGEPEEQVWKDHPHATAQVRALAQGFADRELPVATLLSDRRTKDDDSPDEPEDDALADDDSKEDRDEEGGEQEPQDVGKQHGRQLLDYLSRTRSVRGPGRDLLFLQSTGSAVGLDGQLAERLEEDAANASLDSLLASVRALDDPGRDAVVTLLIGQSLGAVGLEAQNVALSLLAVAALPGVDVPARADALADALADPINDAPDLVEEGGLHGAWRLGLHSERPTALRLRGLVLRYAAANDDDSQIAMTVLRDSDAAIAADSETTAGLLVTHLLSEDGDSAAGIAQVLLGMPPEKSARVLAAAADALAARLRWLLAPPEPHAPATPAATGVGRPAPAPTPPGSRSTETEPALPDATVSALGTLLERLDGSAGGPAHALVGALLKANRRAVRELVESRVARLSPVTDAALASQLIRACAVRPLEEWPAWLSVVAPDAAAAPDTGDAIQGLVNQLWTSGTRTSAPPPVATVQAAASAVVVLLDSRPAAARPSMANAVRQGLGQPVEDDDAANERRRLLDAAEPLLAAGALEPKVLAAKEAEDLAATLRADITPDETDDPVVAYVVATTEDALRGFPRRGVGGQPADPDAQAELVRALHDNTWLPEPHATRLRLLGRSIPGAPDDLPALPAPEEIQALRAEHGRVLDDTLAAWARLAKPEPAALLAAADTALQEAAPSQDLLDAVASSVSGFSAKDRGNFLHGLLDDPDRPAPSADVLRAAGTAGAKAVPDIEVARMLAARRPGATNSIRRKHLMEAWHNARIESEAARKLLFERILIPLFGSESDPAPAAAVDLGIEYLPLLARTQPSKTKAPLGEAVVGAIGEDEAAKVLLPLGYKVNETGIFFRRRKVDTES
jgi:hypothetical protein